MIEPGTRVEFTRECEVVQIPAGIRTTVPKGADGVVTQALGGTFTLQVSGVGSLVRLSGSDADAIGLEPPASAGPASEGGDLESRVWSELKTCYDPEIPVDIVDLGLVYDLRIDPADDGRNDVSIKMTLTAQGCGMGGAIAGDAREKILRLPGVRNAAVDVVWDPPWNPRMISAEGRKRLGIE